MEAEDVRSSFLATTVHLQEDLELSSRDRDVAQAVSDGLRDAKAANTRRVYQTAWHLFCEWTLLTGRQSMPAEPQIVAPLPRPPGHHRAGPGPRSPTPMPPRAYRRAITPPAIRPWPRSSRAGATRLQRLNRPTHSPPMPLALSDVLERTFIASYHRKIRLTETHQGSRQ